MSTVAEACETVSPIWYRKLSKVMRDRGYNAYRLSGAIGVASPTLTRWKQGTGYPTVDQVVALCEVLDIPDALWLVDDRRGIDDVKLPPLATEAQRAIIAIMQKLGPIEGARRVIDAARDMDISVDPDQPPRAVGSADLSRLKKKKPGAGPGEN